MGKRSKSNSTANEPSLVVESKKMKSKKNEPECSDANNESKPEVTIVPATDKQVKRKRNNKTQSTEGGSVKKNKKIIFNDDDDEPVEVGNTPTQEKRNNVQESPQENEDDIKDEDIDKFCDEINEEDNEQYENWVKLIEAKLSSNKKKPK